jgi:hypothetical protein
MMGTQCVLNVAWAPTRGEMDIFFEEKKFFVLNRNIWETIVQDAQRNI